MKKVLFGAVMAFALTSCGELKIPVAEVTGNVQDYPYVYVVPTSGTPYVILFDTPWCKCNA